MAERAAKKAKVLLPEEVVEEVGEWLQNNSAEVEVAKKRSEELLEKETKAVTEVRRKFWSEKLAVWNARKGLLAKIPNFWAAAIYSHPASGSALTEKDVMVLSSCVDVEFVDYAFEGTADSGYSLTLHFAPNPFFENKTLQRVKMNADSDEAKISGIKWKPGQDLAKLGNDESDSFFELFTEEGATDDWVCDAFEGIMEDPFHWVHGGRVEGAADG